MTRNKSRTDKLRTVWLKSNGVCAHCGKAVSSRKRTVDHYVPKSKGGGFDTRNLMPLCVECNKDRNSDDIDPTTFYKYASKTSIKNCLAYEREFSAKHRSLTGEQYE